MQIQSFNLATLGEANMEKLGKQTHRGQTKLRRVFKYQMGKMLQKYQNSHFRIKTTRNVQK